MRPDPSYTLPRKAIKAWRITGGLSSLFLWLVPSGLFLLWMDGGAVPLWMAVASALMVFFAMLLIILLIPEVRWRRWRYQVDEHEIDLRFGVIIIRRTLVPVKRVQHVDTRQGPVLRKFGLSNVTISTAATTHEIPALDEETADRIRNEISTFARLAEEDV